MRNKNKYMKPVISESVYKRLYDLVIKQRSPQGNELGKELSKAEIVEDTALHKDVISLNSVVEFTEGSLNKPVRMQIVLPAEADLEQRKVSILAPISIALIGFKERDRFEWKMQSGIKYFTILKVIN